MATEQVAVSSRNGREQYQRPGSPNQPGGYFWPELRYGREADFSQAYDWDLFLNILGRRNRRSGHVLPLGEVACHYITDTEMRAMILNRYPDAKRDRREARKIYKGIAADSRSYLRMIQASHNKLVNECVYGLQSASLGKTALRMSGGPVPDGRWLSTMFRLRPPGTTFRGYDGNKVGIDLSLNRELFEERRELLRYLGTDERLDTSLVRQDWEPHAVIFAVHPHLSVDRLILKYPSHDQTPEEIPFEAPNAFSDV